MKRFLACLCAATFILGLLPITGYAAVKDFPDVKPGSWFYADIKAARAAGFIAGYPDGTFKPDDKVTFAELVTLVARSTKEEQPLTQGTHWASSTLDYAQAQGWFTSVERPADDAVITRQLTARIIANAHEPTIYIDYNTDRITDYSEIDAMYQCSVKALYGAGILRGDTNGTFRPNDGLSRAETCVLLNRIDNPNTRPIDSPTPYELLMKTGEFTEYYCNDYLNQRYVATTDGASLINTKRDYCGYLVPKNPIYRGVIITHTIDDIYGDALDINIEPWIEKIAMIDANTYRSAADGVSPLTGALGKYGLDANGVIRRVSGFSLISRQYIKSLLKIIFPQDYEYLYNNFKASVTGTKNELLFFSCDGSTADIIDGLYIKSFFSTENGGSAGIYINKCKNPQQRFNEETAPSKTSPPGYFDKEIWETNYRVQYELDKW